MTRPGPFFLSSSSSPPCGRGLAAPAAGRRSGGGTRPGAAILPATRCRTGGAAPAACGLAISWIVIRWPRALALRSRSIISGVSFIGWPAFGLLPWPIGLAPAGPAGGTGPARGTAGPPGPLAAGRRRRTGAGSRAGDELRRRDLRRPVEHRRAAAVSCDRRRAGRRLGLRRLAEVALAGTVRQGVGARPGRVAGVHGSRRAGVQIPHSRPRRCSG